MPVDTVDRGLRFEAFTLPTGTFRRKFDLTKWVSNFSISDKWNEISDGTFELPVSFTKLAQLMTVDKVNHANDIGSIIRVLRGTTPILHYVLRQIDDEWSSDKGTVKCILRGMEHYLDKTRVTRYDYPNVPSRDPDWIYGAPSVIRAIGGETTNEVVQIWTDATSGAGSLTFGAETTGALNFNASSADVKTLLEALTGIVKVDVSGVGDPLNPWTITHVDPGGNVGPITGNVGTLNAALNVTTVRNGGTLSPRPWHGSFNPVTGLTHGTYDLFEIVTTPVPTGDTYALAIDGGTPVFADDFSGGQIIEKVVPGRTYRASIPVRSDTGTQVYRFVIRDMSENWIASTADTSIGTTYTTMSIPTFKVPLGVTEIIYRVGVITAANPGKFYMGIESAILAAGAPASKLGKIFNDVLVPINANGRLTWVFPTWTATLDSAGVGWDRDLEWAIKRKQSLLQLIEYAKRWGYESKGPYWSVANARFQWDLYNPQGGGTDRAGTGLGITGKSGGSSGSGAISRRMPEATYYDAEGDKGEWGESNDSVLSTAWGYLDEYFPNAQGLDAPGLASLAARLVADSALKSDGIVLRMQAPAQRPWQHFYSGDRNIMVNLVPKRTREAMRCVGLVASGGSPSSPQYDAHFGSMVYKGEAAILQQLRELRRAYKTLEQAATPEETLDPVLFNEGAGGALEDASWTFACSNSSPEDKSRADQTLTGTADQTTIHDAVLLHLPKGGTVGFLPGTILANGPLTNCDATGANTSLLFSQPLRFRASGAVIWRYTANPATSDFILRFGGSVAGTYNDPPRVVFDGIMFDGSNGVPGTGFANLDGVAWFVGAGTLPPTLFTGCTFRYFDGDWTVRGERLQSMEIASSLFLNCDPTVVFFDLGGFTAGNVVIHANQFHGCNGVLDSGLGGHLGGMFYGNQIYNGTITWVGSAMHVFHNRIGGTHYAGHHNSATQVVADTLADAKGDLIAATANDTWTRLAVGANKLALHAASAEATGLKWQLPGGRHSITGFHRENLAASLTASQLERSLSATLDAALPVVVTHAGSIVGISVASTEARTVSTATFEVYKNGVATGLTCVLDATNTTFAFAVQAIDLDAVAAGDRLDVRATTTGTWAPVTADVEAIIVLQYDPA